MELNFLPREDLSIVFKAFQLVGCKSPHVQGQFVFVKAQLIVGIITNL